MIDDPILLACLGITAILAVLIAIAAYYISRTED